MSDGGVDLVQALSTVGGTGGVVWLVVRSQLGFLSQQIRELRADLAAAHARIDALLIERFNRDNR